MTSNALFMRRTFLSIPLFLCFALITCSFYLHAKTPAFWQEHEFLPAAEAFPFTVTEQSNDSSDTMQINIKWNITKGYYLYQESIGLLTSNKESIAASKFGKAAIMKFDPNFDKVMPIYKDQLDVEFLIDTKRLPVSTTFQGCAEAGLCYPLQVHPLNFNLASEGDTSLNSKAIDTNYPTLSAEFLPNKQIETLLSQASLLKIVLIFLVLGIGLCLTPCVLPMMPIISGIVLGRDKAFSPLQAFGISSTYVLSMSLTYTAVGIAAASLGASANIQIWMQHPLVLSLFALLFFILALAMFDVYELRLPQFLHQKVSDLSNQQQGGSYLSAGIMGILSAVVVSPCISAPLAGALVFISSTGDVIIGGSALFALGIGMGLPLIALCTLGTSFLPKAGQWLNYSKRFFGVLLIAVAIWMLSRFLNAQFILALWGVLFMFSAFSFGGLSLSKQVESRQQSHPLLKTLQSFLLLWGLIMLIGAALGNHNPLKPLENITQNKQSDQNNTGQITNTHAKKLQFINITSPAELQAELNKNTGSGKILLLDFYADWCTSCKDVEEDIFKNPQFKNFLLNITLVRADLSNNSIENFALLEQLELFGPPSILFFDPQSKELKPLRIQGTISPESFQKVVDQLTEKR